MRKSIILLVLLVVGLTMTLQAQFPVIDTAYIRFAHFSADASRVDLLQNQELFVPGLSFGEITPWQSINPDGYEYAVAAASQQAGLSSEVLELAIAPGQWITVALIGSIERETLRLHPLTEPSDELETGEARISLFNAVETGAAIDLLLNAEALLQLITYPAGSGSSTETSDGFASTNIVASTYTASIKEHGSTNEPLLDLGSVRFISGGSYFFALMGTPDNIQIASEVTMPAIFVAADATPEVTQVASDQTRLRVAHLSSGTPEIDVYINGIRSRFRDLAFGDITPLVTFTPGSYEIAIAPAGTTFAEAAIGPVALDLDTGSWKTIALIGTLTNGTIELQILDDDLRPLGDNDARLTLYHANNLIGPVDLRVADGTPLLQLLSYPGTQGANDGLSTLDLPGGDYALQIATHPAPGEVLAALSDFRLLPGRYYFLALVNAEPPYILAVTDF